MRSVNPSGTVGYEGNDCVLPETDCVAIRFPAVILMQNPDTAH